SYEKDTRFRKTFEITATSMYNGIGLQTDRGSGTNGYIQANKFLGIGPDQSTVGFAQKRNEEILEHNRKRQVELKLLVLEEKLVDHGYTDVEISEKLDEARKSLEDLDRGTWGTHLRKG
ncbi:Hypothetical predicted protein, partial [Olea europaea subsp. europaea]